MGERMLACDIFIKCNGRNLFMCESRIEFCGELPRRRQEPANYGVEYGDDGEEYVEYIPGINIPRKSEAS